jgi:hypothetical protein
MNVTHGLRVPRWIGVVGLSLREPGCKLLVASLVTTTELVQGDVLEAASVDGEIGVGLVRGLPARVCAVGSSRICITAHTE